MIGRECRPGADVSGARLLGPASADASLLPPAARRLPHAPPLQVHNFGESLSHVTARMWQLWADGRMGNGTLLALGTPAGAPAAGRGPSWSVAGTAALPSCLPAWLSSPCLPRGLPARLPGSDADWLAALPARGCAGERTRSFWPFFLQPYTVNAVMSFAEVGTCPASCPQAQIHAARACAAGPRRCVGTASSSHPRERCPPAPTLQLSARTAAGAEPSHPYGRCFRTAHLCAFSDAGYFQGMYGAMQVGGRGAGGAPPRLACMHRIARGGPRAVGGNSLGLSKSQGTGGGAWMHAVPSCLARCARCAAAVTPQAAYHFYERRLPKPEPAATFDAGDDTLKVGVHACMCARMCV